MPQTRMELETVWSIGRFLTAGSNKLPNDIIMKIVKEADGGLTTHKKKFSGVLETIESSKPLYWFVDGCGHLCPYFMWEKIYEIRMSGDRDTFTDSDEEQDSSEDED